MKILSSFIHPHAVLFHSVKEHRSTSDPYDSVLYYKHHWFYAIGCFSLNAKFGLKFESDVELQLKCQSVSHKIKSICITSEALESSAQVTLLWYNFIVLFHPFWSLTVSVHFHCMEKISLAPTFFHSTEEHKPLWVLENNVFIFG